MDNLTLKQGFKNLSLSDRRELLEELLLFQELEGSILEEVGDEIKNKRDKKPCPYCQSQKVYKRGKQQGVQMYKCRETSCNRWYSETTGTALYNIQLKINGSLI